MAEKSGNNEDERSEMALEQHQDQEHFVPGYLIDGQSCEAKVYPLVPDRKGQGGIEAFFHRLLSLQAGQGERKRYERFR
jgi:hypothetical protein